MVFDLLGVRKRSVSAGSRLGRYALVRKLGHGAMGEVYEAIQDDLDRTVAVKVLPRSLTADAQFVTRFRGEAKAAARLSHPNIVTVYDVGEEDGIHFFAMEYIVGVDLDQKLRKERRVATEQAVDLMLQAVKGLKHAWEQRVIHRDIKPANMILRHDGLLKIADFGLAKALGDGNSLTLTGMGMGTPHYMSPEQGRNAKDADFRCDVYSLGATFYHLVTGRVPFDGDSPIDVLLNAEMGRLLPVRQLRPEVPPAVAEIIERMLARKREDRCQDAECLLRDVKAAWRSLAAPPSPSASFDGPSAPRGAAAPAANVQETCPYCGDTAPPEVFDHQTYCANCGRAREHRGHALTAGAATPPATNACPRCGSTDPPHRIGENAYCDNCGVEIAQV